jgi:outer membrane autotransporter protein
LRAYLARGSFHAYDFVSLTAGQRALASRDHLDRRAPLGAAPAAQAGQTISGLATLTGTAKGFDIETTTLGVRGELTFASLPVTFSSMLGWRHAFGDVVPSVLLVFQGGAQSFGVAGIPIDRDAFLAEAGVNYAVTSALTVGLSYSGQFGQRAYDNAFKGHLNLSF